MNGSSDALPIQESRATCKETVSRVVGRGRPDGFYRVLAFLDDMISALRIKKSHTIQEWCIREEENY